MGLDASVFADDDCAQKIASVRLGNLDAIARLRERIEQKTPEATVLLTRVLYSAFHSGDTLTQEEVVQARLELAEVSRRFPDDGLVLEFTTTLGDILATAVKHRRPLTFT